MKSLVALSLISSSLIFSSCVSNSIARESSAGQIGCTPEDIQISPAKVGMSSVQTWVATCRSKRHICSRMPGDVGRADVVGCKEELK